jgi:hypothetical protein
MCIHSYNHTEDILFNCISDILINLMFLLKKEKGWVLNCLQFVSVWTEGIYFVFAATGLPVFKFSPISLHAIGTMFTVAG